MTRMTVILTATVTPQVSNFVHPTSQAERIKSYELALENWTLTANRADAHVVFAENSGFDLQRFSHASRYRSRITMLNVPPPSPGQSQLGKGAAEQSILDYAMKALGPGDSEYVFKCTGRLFVRNFLQSLPPLPIGGPRVIADIPRGSFAWVDSRFFGGNALAWREQLVKIGRDSDDLIGVNYEHGLASAALRFATESPGSVQTFAEKPWIVGTSGTTGHRYGRGVKSTLRHTLAMPLDRIRRRVERELRGERRGEAQSSP